MKVLKIFLRLKAQEIWGFIKNISIGIFSFIIIGVISTGNGYLLCKNPEINKLFVNEKTIFLKYLYAGFILICIVCLISLVILCCFLFYKWISSNWQEAKRIAKEGE